MTDQLFKRLEIVMGLCRKPIPPQFWRTFEGAPFETCTYCGARLLQEKLTYLVMKSYQDGEVQHEIAVCRACSTALKVGYSEESKATLKQVYGPDYQNRRLEILTSAAENADLTALMTAHCSLCQAPRQGLSEFVEYALCQNDELLYYTHPSLVCAACTLRVYDTLSEETKAYKRRFFEEHYGWPPPEGVMRDTANSRPGLWELV